MTFEHKINRRGFMGGAIALGAVAVIGPRFAFAQDATAPALAGTATWTKFNLNAASDEQFLSIPGTGDRMLREFNEYKPYTSIAQFRAEIGKYVDEDTISGYEKYVFVPIDVTSADADTLAQLPGVDPDTATELAGAVPYVDEAAFMTALSGMVSAEQAAAAAPFMAGAGAATATWVKFDLNSATEEQLKTIPGVGDEMLHEFDEYKPYASIAQFRAEIGKYVDEATVAGYEKYVFVPVDPTAADADTLAQLPGVDADKAAELAKAVPYADAAALIAALGSVVSAEQAAEAAGYIKTA